MVVIGLYSMKDGDGLPNIQDLISPVEIKEKEKIVSYLNNAKVDAACAGTLYDPITGEKIRREWLLFTDGEYIWHSYVPYLVEKYNMRLPEQFIEHVLKQ